MEVFQLVCHAQIVVEVLHVVRLQEQQQRIGFFPEPQDRVAVHVIVPDHQTVALQNKAPRNLEV